MVKSIAFNQTDGAGEKRGDLGTGEGGDVQKTA